MGLGKAFQLPKATAEDIEILDCECSLDFNSHRLAMHLSRGQSHCYLIAREPPVPLSSSIPTKIETF